MLLGACTEPNPYLPMAETSPASSSGSGEPPSSTTSATSSSSGPDDASSSSSGATSECVEQGMTCVAAAPEGFQGPFAWLERPVESPLRCMAPFEAQRIEAFSDLAAPAARCSCACGPLGNASCGPASLERYGDVSCGGAVQEQLALAPGCNVIPGSGWASSTSFFFDAPAVEGGCLPLPSLELVPAAFLTRHLACEGVLAHSGCEAGQLCAPRPDDPFHARFCVVQEGDVACPEDGAYVERTVLYRDITDERGCQPCSCALPSGSCTGTSAVLSTALNCSAVAAGVPPEGCVGGVGVGTFRSAVYVEGSVPDDAACDPAVVVPTGDASGTEPITFCCMR